MDSLGFENCQSNYIRLCKRVQNRKMQSFYTFWLKKHPYQLGQNCAFMHNCYSNHAYIHSYCSICISYFSIFFFSHPLFFSLSPLTLTSFVFSIRAERQNTLSTLCFSYLIPLASTIADRHQCLAADQHHTTVANQHQTTRCLIKSLPITLPSLSIFLI